MGLMGRGSERAMPVVWIDKQLKPGHHTTRADGRQREGQPSARAGFRVGAVFLRCSCWKKVAHELAGSREIIKGDPDAMV